MANVIYPKAKEQMLQGGINLLSGVVKAVLIDLADYTYSATHEFLSDVAAGAREEMSAALTGKTFVNGLFDADDTVWPAATGDPSEAVILIIDTGNPATSRLITFFDTGVTGLPVTPNSGAIDVQFNASGIFQL